MARATRRQFLTRAAGGAIALPLAVSPLARAVYASTSDSQLYFRSASELAALLAAGKIGSVELTRLFIERIERFDGALNAIPVRDFDRALAAADAADAALQRGTSLGPLHGVPMTIKESYNIAGLPTTWGVPDWQANVPDTDAEVVRRFKAAGAHFMGKTNVPFMLGDFQSYNDIYGVTNNPWNLERSPGGSSGGSAAALAAGLTALDSGSDIGGSIRNPAHMCGIYGHKPTWNVVPSNGHAVPRAEGGADLAVVGPLARSAEDLQLAMRLCAGANPLDAAGWRLELPPPRQRSLKDLRVAVLADSPIAPVDAEVRARVEQVAEMLEAVGAQVSRDALPELDLREAHDNYLGLLTAVTGGDRVKTEYRNWMIMNSKRQRIRMAWQAFFERWDILLCPIMPTTALHHDHSIDWEARTIQVNGKAQAYGDQVFWAGLATGAYLPSTVFPTGAARDGLPIGLQAIGGEYNDYTTIEFTRLVAAELGGFASPPAYAAPAVS